MKLFVMTDIHGFYTEMKRELDAAGFEPGNPAQLLISCGDNFDRGTENTEVFRFLSSVPNKVLIRGNHEFMLGHMIDTGIVRDHHVQNRTVGTLAEFTEQSEEAVCRFLVHLRHRPIVRELRELVSSMRCYYETAHYVFVHGWLPVRLSSLRSPEVLSDWRGTDEMGWEDASWGRWYELWRGCSPIPGKTVVCGHRSVSYGHELFRGVKDCYEPFLDRGIIALDACTVRSRRVNILTVEDDLI